MKDYTVYVPPVHRSHLFTVRVWQEEVEEGEQEWRGKVQHVLSGQVRYFRQWPTLAACLLALLEENPNVVPLQDEE